MTVVEAGQEPGAVAVPGNPAAAPSATPEPAQGVWAGVLRSVGARIAVLGISGLLGLVVTRLVILHYGEPAFAQYGLLVGIAGLLPFTDLGMAAAVMDAAAGADVPATDERLRRTLVSSLRVLLGSAAVVAAAAVAITLAGWWPAILGADIVGATGSTPALLCLLLIAVGIPLGVGQRILTGLGRNHVSIAVNGLQTPIVLLTLVVLLRVGVPAANAIAPIAYAATAALAGVTTILGARKIRPAFRAVLEAVPRVRNYRGAPVFGLAWPLLVQLVAVPLAMQSDRLVLSHRAGVHVVAQYSLASQMFTPIWALVTAGGMTLWRVFARARAQGGEVRPFSTAWVFGGAAAAMSAGVGLLSPWLAHVASGGRIRIGVALVLAFAALMVVQALKYPLGMFLTDRQGLRYQAAMIAVMLPVNLGTSWVLAGWMGAAGPVVGSVLGVGLFELGANAVYVRRRLRRTAAAGTGAADVVTA